MPARIVVPLFGLDFEQRRPASGVRTLWSRTVLVAADEASSLQEVRASLEERDFDVFVESPFERALHRLGAQPDAYAAVVTILDPLLPAAIRFAERVRVVAPRIGLALWSPTRTVPRVAAADVMVGGPGSLESLADALTLLVDPR